MPAEFVVGAAASHVDARPSIDEQGIQDAIPPFHRLRQVFVIREDEDDLEVVDDGVDRLELTLLV